MVAEARPWALAGVVLVTFGTYPARAWRYGCLLAPLARVPFRRLLAAVYLGFLAGLFVPRAGEVLRPWLVSRRHPVPLGAAFAALLVERLVDVATVLGLFAGGLLLSGAGQRLDAAWRARLGLSGLAAGLLATGTLALLLALAARPDAARRVLPPLLRPLPAGLHARLTGAAEAFGTGLRVLRASPRHLAGIAGQSVLVWCCIAGGMYAANRAFAIDLPFDSAFVVLGFVLLGVTVPTPAGLGGFETAYVLALTVVFGVERERAAAAAVACHGLTSLAVLVTGLSFLPGEGLTLRQVTAGPGREA